MFGSHAALPRGLIFLAGLLLFLAGELVRPYRPPTVAKPGRWVVNLSLAGLNSVILNLLLGAAVLATAVQAQGQGLLDLLDLPWPFRLLLAVVGLDFMLYAWHLLNHKAPLLWRFHRVHHSDLNMDVSTASRFHLGELLASAGIKMGLVHLLGAGPREVLVFDAAVVLAAQFHHSSLAVPERFDRLWRILFVPPSLHRIHHSVKIQERDTNFGTIFSLWDRLLGTLSTQVDQAGIRIGLGAYPDPARLGLLRLLAMPFTQPVR